MYITARVVATVALLLALGGAGSDDYYTLVHFMVSMVAAYGAALAFEWARTATTPMWRTKQTRWMWTYATIALLFNPFLPVRLHRDTWAVLELGCGILFGERVAREVRANYRARRRQQRKASE